LELPKPTLIALVVTGALLSILVLVLLLYVYRPEVRKIAPIVPVGYVSIFCWDGKRAQLYMVIHNMDVNPVTVYRIRAGDIVWEVNKAIGAGAKEPINATVDVGCPATWGNTVDITIETSAGDYTYTAVVSRLRG
jgi:hypothetical protein